MNQKHYEVVGKTSMGTYAVEVSARNGKEAIRKARPLLKSMVFGNYPFRSIWVEDSWNDDELDPCVVGYREQNINCFV